MDMTNAYKASCYSLRLQRYDYSTWFNTIQIAILSKKTNIAYSTNMMIDGVIVNGHESGNILMETSLEHLEALLRNE